MAKVASRPSVEAEALVTSNAGGTAASGLEWISWAKAEVDSVPCSKMKANVLVESLGMEANIENSSC
jgi:hypothetical protein